MDLEHESFALKRMKVHIRRIKSILKHLESVKDKIAELKRWRKPWENVAVMLLIGALVLYPSCFIAGFIMLLAMWCSVNYR